MKRLQYFSVDKLNKISKHKEIYCYGCGKIFYELIERYADEPFVQNITKVIDGNKNIWGTSVKVRTKEICIESPYTVEKIKSNDVLILITINRYEEVYESLCKMVSGEDIVCSKYPDMYYGITKYILKFFSLFLKKNRLLFRVGKEPHENAIAILSYLNKVSNSFDVVLLTDEKEHFESKIRMIYVRLDTLKSKSKIKDLVRFCYYYSSSKFLCYESDKIEKAHDRQILCFMNHGILPLKNVKDVLRQPDELDFAICPAKGCSEIYREQYGVPTEKQIYFMHPRVGMLWEHENELQRMAGHNNKQIIMWLPTFRQLKESTRADSDSASGLSLIAEESNLKRLDEILEEQNQILVIKLHPRDRQSISLSKDHKNIFVIQENDLKNAGITLQQVLGKVSALLTDYSSIAFEYMFLNRPIGYVINDLERYSRGFVIDNPLEYMPGERIEKMEDLFAFLKHVYLGEDDYMEQRAKVVEKLFCNSNPRTGAEDFIKFIEGKNESKN